MHREIEEFSDTAIGGSSKDIYYTLHYAYFQLFGATIVEPQTSFTEFGGVLGIQKRLTLERTDMKLGRFN